MPPVVNDFGSTRREAEGPGSQSAPMVVAPRTTSEPDAVYAFGDFTLDTASRELKRGDDVLHVEPKVFDLLSTLVAQPNRVISRAEFAQQLWSGEAVCDGALSQCVWSARKLLGDQARTPRFIKTVPRRGFRFIAPVSRSRASAQGPAHDI